MRKLTVILVLFLVTLPLMADSLDVTPTQMISPQKEQVGPFNPSAVFVERGGAETLLVYLNCLIETLDTGQGVYVDSVLEDFSAYEEKIAVFPETELDSACYKITFWAEIRNHLREGISYPPLVDTFCYTGIAEQPAREKFGLDVIINMGPQIVLRYSGCTQGFDVEVFDAIGAKVGELDVEATSGVITWGRCHGPGVYFICVQSERSAIIQKVILIQ